MGKSTKNRNVTVCVIPFAVNCLINMIVFIKIVNIFTNSAVRGALRLGKAFGIELSASNVVDILGFTAEWDLSPLELKLMAVVQLGIMVYVFVLFWGICNDINCICGRYEGDNGKKSPNYLVVMLLSVVTLRIYYFYWVYRQGNRLQRADQNYYQRNSKDSGILYLLLTVFGGLTFGITDGIFVARLLHNLNVLSEDRVQEDSCKQRRYMESAVPAQDRPTEAVLEEDPVTMPVEDWAPMTGLQEGSMACSSGVYEGAVFPVGSEELMIGRDESAANIVIKNPKISRKHCGIRYMAEKGIYVVMDYSTNGIFYKNGQKFQKGVPNICYPGTVFVIAQSGNEFLLK